MLKNKSYFTLLLFANIILLVHAAVPHHHHHDIEICFTHLCEHHDSQTSEQEESSSLHQCCIDSIYFPAHNLKITGYPHNYNSEQALFALIPNSSNIQNRVDQTVIQVQQNPYVPLFFSEFVSRSIGLRAPPFQLRMRNY